MREDAASLTPTTSLVPSDESLLRQLREGAPGAQRMLFDAHAPRVWRLLFRLTGDYDEAHDLTQETFLHAFRRLDRFSARGSLAGWLAQVAVNRLRDDLRRRRRRRERLQATAIAAQTESPGDPLLDARVRDAVERLSRDERVVVLMHDVEGYTHEEIAQTLDIATGSSRARLSRARARLRDWLHGIQEEVQP